MTVTNAHPNSIHNTISPNRAAIPRDRERDICYTGYSARAMHGPFLICILGASIAGMLVIWLRSWPVVTILGTASVSAGWIFCMFQFLYRKIGFVVRLTTHRVIQRRGFLYPSTQFTLSDFRLADTEYGPLDRLLKVGRILLREEPHSPPVLVLEGVSRPEELAQLCRIAQSKLVSSDRPQNL